LHVLMTHVYFRLLPVGSTIWVACASSSIFFGDISHIPVRFSTRDLI
jgi:hypothetical protein